MTNHSERTFDGRVAQPLSGAWQILSPSEAAQLKSALLKRLGVPDATGEELNRALQDLLRKQEPDVSE